MKGTIKKTLNSIGLSEKESEVYIFLGKRGPLKGSQISKQLKINKGQVYRILKGLQKKDLVEATLEYPTRFTAIPFEKVIDSFIKSKRQEVDLIEESKKDLLSDWKKISQTELESSLERFSVIEGRKKIFQKMSQMIRETVNHFFATLNVSDLIEAEKNGVFTSIGSEKSNYILRVLTQPSEQNLKNVKHLQSVLPSEFKLRSRNDELGLSYFPRVVIRDNDEILLFISDSDFGSNLKSVYVCLSTNCKCIIQSFVSIFEDSWSKSMKIEDKIIEIETGKSSPTMELIKDRRTAQRLYYDKLNSAKKEILIVSSSRRLIGILKNINLLKSLLKNNVSIKIMAPITCENLGYAKQLLEHSEVRHIPVGYRETTIIDDQNLFQFNTPCKNEVDDCEDLNLENVFFTNNKDYVKRTKNMLIDFWKKTHEPSKIKLDHNSFLPLSEDFHVPLNKCDRYGLGQVKYVELGKISEKDVLDKFEEIKKNSSRNWLHTEWKDTLYFLGNRAFVSIRPPEYFGIPDIIIGIFQNFEVSSFGQENILKIFMKPKQTTGTRYQLVAHVQDNQKSISYRKRLLAGMPGGNNVILLKPNQLTIRLYGSTLFAGWTMPIPLIPSRYVLPPSCILFEGYGKVKSGIFSFTFPSGSKQKVWFSTKDAFVTFFHPSARYVGSGTEGFLDTDSIQISYPPKPD